MKNFTEIPRTISKINFGGGGLKAYPRTQKLNYYFGPSNLDKTFREGVSRPGPLTVKVLVRNIELIKSLLMIRGKNIVIRVSEISPPFQTLESLGCVCNVANVWATS